MLEPDSNTREIHLNSLAETMQGKSYLDNVNCFETNGDVKYNECDVLPNNNLCEKTVSQCYNSDGDYSNRSEVMSSSVGKTLSQAFSEESTSDEPLQESDVHSLQSSGKWKF